MLSYIARKFAQRSSAKHIHRTIKAHGPAYDATSASIARRRWGAPCPHCPGWGAAPRAPLPCIAGAGWGQGAGQWEQGQALGAVLGENPLDVCVLRRGPARTPTLVPGPRDAALWKPGLSSDPVPGPHVPALCPHCPLAQGPPWRPPVCAPCRDPSLLPEALGPLQGLPSSPRRPPPPPSAVRPTALAAGQQCRLQRAGEGALVTAVRRLRSPRTRWMEQPCTLSPRGRVLGGSAQGPWLGPEQPGWRSTH